MNHYFLTYGPHLLHIYVEYMYGSAGTDADFVDVHSLHWFERSPRTYGNANTLLNLNTMSWGLTPTHFQLHVNNGLEDLQV